MRALNIKEAKAHLNELIDAALEGEQVVLMRGSKHVATLTPITDDEIEVVNKVTDAQATRLWRQLAEERAAGQHLQFATPAAAVSHLLDVSTRRPTSGSRKPRPRG